MKQLKRSGIYKAANVNFDPARMTAFSYDWWQFVAKVRGKIVFNEYGYSNSTRKHQSKVRSVMRELGIEPDLYVSFRANMAGMGMSDIRAAHKAQQKADAEYAEQKRIERNRRAAYRRKVKRLEDYLENQCAFRDYDILPAKRFGSVNKVAVHQRVDMKTMESDVENAIQGFHRDGFGSIVFYVEGN